MVLKLLLIVFIIIVGYLWRKGRLESRTEGYYIHCICGEVYKQSRLYCPKCHKPASESVFRIAKKKDLLK